jgi:iron complex outermembrane receptor protein
MRRCNSDRVGYRRRSAEFLGLALLAIGPDTLAQERGDAAVQEVIVTARRVEESLQQTPVAVTALTAADLEARGVTSLDEVGRYTPNVAFFASGISGKSSGQVYIRGVGQFDYLLTTDPGVGIYVDGVYLARSLGNILDLVDIDRVEVLRGPQGTLYGKNTVGGAINVVTRKPTNDLQAGVELQTGSYGRIDARASISGALVPDVLTAKLAAGTRNADGFGRRPLARDRSGDEGSDAVQGLLHWQASASADVLLSADYTRIDEAMAFHHTEEINTSAPLVALNNALAGPLAALHGVPMYVYDDRWLDNPAYTDLSTDSNFNKQKIWGLSAAITWKIGGTTLKSISAYRNMDLSYGTDPDGSPAVIIDEVDVNSQDQLTQELQFSGLSFDDRLTWVAGAYYLKEDADSTLDIWVHPAIFQALEALPAALVPLGPVTCPAPLPAPCAGGAGNPINALLDVSRFSTLRQTTKSASVYGQGSYTITDRLSGTYGIRYTHEKKDFAYSLRLKQTGIPLVPLSSVNDSWSDVSHRAGLEYRWNDDLMTYVSAAKGFKSGGFNGRGQTVNEIQAYAPETLWSYELGVKSEWLDRRLRLNGALFYYDYNDMQFSLSTSDSNGLQVVVVGNAAAAEIKGAEAEIVAVPVRHLQLSASVGYLDSRYTSIEPGADISVDDKLIGSPEWTVAAGAEYAIPLAQRGSLALRADYTYRSKTYFDAVNTESVAQDGYGLVNLRAAFKSASEKWVVAAGVTNVTDETYKVMGVGVLDSLGFSSAVFGRPREWFLQASYRL